MQTLQNLPSALPGLFDPSFSVKVVEVAKKYNQPEGTPIERIPEYTVPGGPNNYHCSKIASSWTQGFFPGLIWLVAERLTLLPESIESSYQKEELIKLARRWQESFRYLARPSVNHDQGFRFQLSFGRDYDMTGSEDAKQVVITAADSLVDRYSDKTGCIRSWDELRAKFMDKEYSLDNMDEHYLVIIDNMMNLDMMYEATNYTGNPRYADIANSQAEKSSDTHVRSDGTTFHVVNMDQKTGKGMEFMTAQGYADDSCWARGQAWGIYGYAQCALRSGRQDFTDICRKLSDVFLSLLPESGVPWWDFTAPRPCPYDASAATIAACGLLKLVRLLKASDPAAAEHYLAAAFKLIEDTLRECAAPSATLSGGSVDFGAGGWETILMHSTINGNPKATRQFMDHGLIYADYYLLEFGNEALKMQKETKVKANGVAKVNGHAH